MQSAVFPYLTFAGNCREAMDFYQQCLGGELLFQTIGSVRTYKKMPLKMRECILHSVLKKGSVTLMASDIVGDEGLIKGTSSSISLHFPSQSSLKACYKKLSVGGEPTCRVRKTEYGSYFASLIDKFGNSWFLSYSPKRKD